MEFKNNVLKKNGICCHEDILENIVELKNKLYGIKSELKEKNKTSYAIEHMAIGKLYGTLKTRLLIYGQNPNGWENEKESAYDDVARMLSGEGFNWINIDDYNRQTNGGKYFLSKSAFWRMSKRIFDELTQDEDKSKMNPRIWQDFISQGNTLKIGYSEDNRGNVKGGEIDAQRDVCYELLCKEIELLKPTHIVFMTNDKEYCFNELIEQLKAADGKYIKRKGKFMNAQTVIMRHPQFTKSNVYFEECMSAFDNM